MTHPRTTFRSQGRAPRPGFTLIEVMLAVVILGLGVLGLAALFAGAAGQQQRSNEINLSVGLARNAEALLTRNLGRLAGNGLQTLIADGEDGHWFPTVASRRNWSLTLDPEEMGRLFFLVEAHEQSVFSHSRDPMDVPIDDLGGNDSMTIAEFPPMLLADARVHPDNIQVVIEIWRDDMGTPAPSREILFVGPNGLTEDEIFRVPALESAVLSADGSPAYPGDAINPTFSGARALAMDMNEPFEDFVWIDLKPRPNAPGDTAIIEFYIGSLGMDEWVERVSVLRYEWRNSRLVSLNDRFIFEDDDRYPGGRRPVMGYTALLRTINGGAASQLTIFTYALSPVAVPGANNENRGFIPPETQQAMDEGEGRRGLLRSYTATLAFDSDRRQHYLEVPANPDDRNRHVVNPGQILMMSKSDIPLGDVTDSGFDDGATPGSDVPVRVIAQQRVGNALRGYLDRSPRVRGRSPLRTESDTPTITLWGFNPTVESLTSDRTVWRIRPVEARQFQLVFDN